VITAAVLIPAHFDNIAEHCGSLCLLLAVILALWWSYVLIADVFDCKKKGAATWPTLRSAAAASDLPYPHLPAIHKSIHALYRHLSAPRVRSFNESIQFGQLFAGAYPEPSLAVQQIAKKMASFLGLQIGPIIVTFRDDLEVPGRVELTRDSHFFVDVCSAYRGSPRDVAAILAHEVAHIFLHRAGLSLEGSEDEILTDTTAAYLGLGWLALDSYAVNFEQVNPQNTRLTKRQFGYLTPEECGYVLAKRALVFGELPANWLRRVEGKYAYEQGYSLAFQEYRVPPLASALSQEQREYAKRRRRAQRARGGSHRYDHTAYDFEGNGILRVSFPCPVCFQRLRIPVREGEIVVHCPVCGGRFDCVP
jgi:hypothetical protein